LKKRTKKLLLFCAPDGRSRLPPDAGRAGKSFLVLFFKKELLPCYPFPKTGVFMKFASLATAAAENMNLPDALLRAGIAARVADSARVLRRAPADNAAFAAWMASQPIAVHTDAANAQHYELPAAFFEACLGPHRKYSSCYYPSGGETLGQAEEAALLASCDMADLRDGQQILELGCGWGSLSLFMAAKYPAASVCAVSNSASQRGFIEAQAASRGLRNIRVLTEDMNRFEPDARFDRIVSVEMFEHMTNWRALLTRVRSWLAPEGRVFLHVFTHAESPYRFDHEHGADWIARYFFTGGIMPSHGLLREFGDILEIEAELRWSGTHYERTANQWLLNFDAKQHVIMPLLRETYGSDAPVWRRRWRLFFLAVAGLFGHAGGQVWGVSQYRLKDAAV
jgi:cyclopropane-fatty-acyl-phospholipid synthase